MTAADNNIFPVFGDLMQRHHKEAQLKQSARAFWLTGLSGSGKTTIAKGLEKELHRLGFFTQVLDGDNIRAGLNGNLGFSEEDRTENIRRIGEVSKLFVNAGIVTINCFVSPTVAIREQARDIIGKDDFLEVFVNTPLEVCEQRDVKGLYVKARAGEIKNFTGIDAPFEAPEHPSIDLKTADQTVDESVAELLNFVLEHIKYED